MKDYEINDNEEDVTCRLCGEQCKRIYGKHLKFAHNGMTTKEYKEKFPDAPITSLKDKNKTSVNSGDHMKTEKYKKMFSEKYSGEKNPMHSSKRTELQRKQNSPFSVEFYKKKYPNMIDSEIEIEIGKVAEKAKTDRLLPSNKEYWMLRGYEEEDSIKKVSERQTTFSKKICIEKYGKIEGIKRWMDRQEKWHKNYKKSNFSKISQKLYQSIWNNIKNDIDDVYFATLNENKIIEENTGRNFEFRLNLETSFILPDFFIPSKMKIIEFDGTYYHRPTPENKKREEIRDDAIRNNGYEVLHILEGDYLKNEQEVIQKCLNFLNN